MARIRCRCGGVAACVFAAWLIVTARLFVLKEGAIDETPPRFEFPTRNLVVGRLHSVSDGKVSALPERRLLLHTCSLKNETITIPEVPSFVIIGAQKSGTTAIARYLAAHPYVLDTRKAGREPHFFDNAFRGMKDWYRMGKYASVDEFYCHARQRYANLFFDTETLLEPASANNGTRLMSFDKTPSYIHLPDAAHDLGRTCPWLEKIVVILRNPVDRAYSHYRMNLGDRTNKREWGTFEHHINDELNQMHKAGLIIKPSLLPDASLSPKEEENRFAKLNGPPLLRKGLYSIQLLQWLESFPDPDMLLVVNFDDLEADSRGVYQQILRHVGLPAYDLPEGYKPLYAGSYEPMRNDTRHLLEDFFAPYNSRLEALLGDNWHSVWERERNRTQRKEEAQESKHE